MRNLRLFLLLLISVVAVTSGTYAQDGPPPNDSDNQERPEGRRPNLLTELGLSPDQVQQIRRFNQERRAQMVSARRRMAEAARNLDLAIYAESVNDAEVQTRLREFQAAEVELSRLRFEGELAIRKVLTSEQLVRFRELRRRFAEARRQNKVDRRSRRRQGGIPPM